MANDSYTIDELICVCISRQINDGELVAQGIATPLVAAGYLLAKCTHAPNLTFVSAIGQGICREWAPLGIATIEELWIGNAFFTLDFIRAACDFLPQFGLKEFFRPGQIDAYGNFNNVFIGQDYSRPLLRLPGAGGIPDVTVFEEDVLLYIPRHGRHTFVEKLDFCSGLGHSSQRRYGRGPQYLITDLGEFDFGGENGRMRLRARHPGVKLRRIQAKTGFALEIPATLPETTPPTAAELKLLRELIDPLGVRTLETLRGAQRRVKCELILKAERALKRNPT